MGLIASVGITFIFLVADASFVLILYIHGNELTLFGKDLYDFSFSDSLFEFWLFSFVRVIVLGGAACFILLQPSDGGKRLAASAVSRYAVGFLAIAFIMYTVAKILIYSEYQDGNHDNDSWFWTLASWTMLASIIMYVIFVEILGGDREILHITTSKNYGKLLEERNLSGGNRDSESDGSDVDNHLDDDDRDYPLENKQEKNSAYLRLLLLTRHDLFYFLAGMTGLMFASFGMPSNFLTFFS